MTILGLGSDIVEIERIARVVDRFGDLLGRRVLSKSEWYKYKVYKQPVRFLAKLFAIKEAAVKALGTGMRGGVSFKQIEVYKDTLGKPCLHFLEQAKIIANQLGVNRVHVTVSDERYYAYAVVIIEN